MRVLKIIFFFVFIFYIQAQDKDIQSWNNIEFTYDVADNLRLSLDNGFRFTENTSVMSKYFLDLSVKRKHNKMFSYAIGYRYLLYREINPLELEEKNRFYLDTYFKKNISKSLKYALRTRFQTQIHEDVVNKLRQKIKFTYDIEKVDVDVVLLIEGFYFVGDALEKLRYQIGFIKPIAKKTNLNLGYMIQQELDHSDLFFVVRAKLSHEF